MWYTIFNSADFVMSLKIRVVRKLFSYTEMDYFFFRKGSDTQVIDRSTVYETAEDRKRKHPPCSATPGPRGHANATASRKPFAWEEAGTSRGRLPAGGRGFLAGYK